MLGRPALAAAALPAAPPAGITFVIEGDWHHGRIDPLRRDRIVADMIAAGYARHPRLSVGDTIEGYASTGYASAAQRAAQRRAYVDAETRIGGSWRTGKGNHDQFRQAGETDAAVTREWEAAFGPTNTSFSWGDGRRCIIRLGPDAWNTVDHTTILLPARATDYLLGESRRLLPSNPVQVLAVHAPPYGTVGGTADYAGSTTAPWYVKPVDAFAAAAAAAPGVKLIVSGHLHVGPDAPNLITTVALGGPRVVCFNAPGLVQVGRTD